MNHSPTTAVLRVYDTGQDHVAVYYIDLTDEQQLVDVWPRSEVTELAQQFAREQGFDNYTLAVVRLGATSRLQ